MQKSIYHFGTGMDRFSDFAVSIHSLIATSVFFSALLYVFPIRANNTALQQ